MSNTRFWFLAVILLVGILLSLLVGKLGHPFSSAAYRDLKVPFSEFPHTVGDWSGEDRPLTAGVIATAGLDEYLRRTYVRKDGSSALFYICYYGNKDRGLQSIYHNPTICFPSSGWEWAENRLQTVTLTDVAQQFEVSLDQFVREGRTLVVLNFFILNGEVWEKPPRNKPFGLGLEKLKISTDPGYFAQVQVVVQSTGRHADAARTAVEFLEEAGRFVFMHF